MTGDVPPLLSNRPGPESLKAKISQVKEVEPNDLREGEFAKTFRTEHGGDMNERKQNEHLSDDVREKQREEVSCDLLRNQTCHPFTG